MKVPLWKLAAIFVGVEQAICSTFKIDILSKDGETHVGNLEVRPETRQLDINGKVIDLDTIECIKPPVYISRRKAYFVDVFADEVRYNTFFENRDNALAFFRTIRDILLDDIADVGSTKDAVNDRREMLQSLKDNPEMLEKALTSNYIEKYIIEGIKLPEIVTGLKYPSCYDWVYINYPNLGSTNKIMINNKVRDLTFTVGQITYPNLKELSSFYPKISGQIDDKRSIHIDFKIFWPQTGLAGQELRHGHIANLLGSSKKNGVKVFFQVVHSGNFEKNLEVTIKNSHPSVSIFGPLAHVYTQLRAYRVNNPSPKLSDSPVHDYSYINIALENFKQGYLQNIADELFSMERVVVKNAETSFRGLLDEEFEYLHDGKASVSLAFSTGISLDVNVEGDLVQQRHEELIEIMKNEYYFTILAALNSNLDENDVIFLQPLVDPKDKVLFKINMQALALAMQKAVDSKMEIPKIRLTLPCLGKLIDEILYQDVMETIKKDAPSVDQLNMYAVSASSSAGIKIEQIKPTTQVNIRQKSIAIDSDEDDDKFSKSKEYLLDNYILS